MSHINTAHLRYCKTMEVSQQSEYQNNIPKRVAININFSANRGHVKSNKKVEKYAKRVPCTFAPITYTQNIVCLAVRPNSIFIVTIFVRYY